MAQGPISILSNEDLYSVGILSQVSVIIFLRGLLSRQHVLFSLEITIDALFIADALCTHTHTHMFRY